MCRQDAPIIGDLERALFDLAVASAIGDLHHIRGNPRPVQVEVIKQITVLSALPFFLRSGLGSPVVVVAVLGPGHELLDVVPLDPVLVLAGNQSHSGIRRPDGELILLDVLLGEDGQGGAAVHVGHEPGAVIVKKGHGISHRGVAFHNEGPVSLRDDRDVIGPVLDQFLIIDIDQGDRLSQIFHRADEVILEIGVGSILIFLRKDVVESPHIFAVQEVDIPRTVEGLPGAVRGKDIVFTLSIDIGDDEPFGCLEYGAVGHGLGVRHFHDKLLPILHDDRQLLFGIEGLQAVQDPVTIFFRYFDQAVVRESNIRDPFSERVRAGFLHDPKQGQKGPEPNGSAAFHAVFKCFSVDFISEVHRIYHSVDAEALRRKGCSLQFAPGQVVADLVRRQNFRSVLTEMNDPEVVRIVRFDRFVIGNGNIDRCFRLHGSILRKQ